MGAAGSTTRRISVRNDDPRIIQVSEDVVRRLQSTGSSTSTTSTGSQHSSGSSESTPLPPPPPVPQAPAPAPRQEKIVLGYGNEGLPTIETISALEMRKQKDSELRANDRFWQEKLRDIEARYKNSEIASGQEFTKKLTRLSALVPQKGEEKCKEVSTRVAECYKNNPTQTLKCSDVVKEFATCVERGTTVT